MLAESSSYSLEKFFQLYRERFDKEGRLSALAPDTTVAGFWQKLQNELELEIETLGEQLAELTQLSFYKERILPPVDIARRLPSKTQSRFGICIVGLANGEPLIAASNPLDEEMLEALAFIFDSHYQLVLASPEAIAFGMEVSQQTSLENEQKSKSLHLADEGGSEAEQRAAPKLARQLMLKALEQNSSDLHLQPFLNGSVVRIRVDGMLKRLTMLSENMADSIIRFFKAESGMDPTHNMIPQDGRMLVDIDGHEYDLRISTLPVTGRHEKLVVRFLNRQTVYNLTDIGFSLDEIHAVHRLAARPSGVVLVCGPTGSGKTTTLYSTLSTLNDEATSIMTVENPVEYQMQGLSQTEVNAKAGMTFAKALRAILRQDPDVLLIGEIRDEETAQIAMQSALTGHLVFSTLHTNDALSAIPRLLDLNINPVILAESLAGILSQRLLRKLCQHCKKDADPKTDPASKAFKSITKTEQACVAAGCEKCNFSGYQGRTVVAEIVEINQAQRELLLGGEQDITKFKAAMRGTFSSMPMSASRLIISGLTTSDEAFRVLGQQFWFVLANEYNQPMPDLSALYEFGDKNKISNAVLIAGKLNESSKLLQSSLEDNWLQTYTASEPEEADKLLRKYENISFLVLELSDALTEAEAIESVARYRRHVAWSRLPALIRIPAGKSDWEAAFRAEGATSRFVTSAMPEGSIVEIVRQAISDHVDFKWGIDI